LARVFLLSEFERQDILHAEQNARRAASVPAQILSSLEGAAKDWGWWDETYQAVQGGDEAFTQANLIDNTFENLQINLIVLLDASGEPILARAYDLQSEAWADPPPDLLEQLGRDHPLIQDPPTPATARSGLIVLPEGVLLAAAAPILPTSLEGPPAGTLLVGRWLDADLLARLSDLTGYPLELLPAPADPGALGWLEGDVWAVPLDKQSIDGFALLADVYGENSVVLRVRSPRQIYQSGQTSLSFFTFGLIALLVLFTLLGMWLMDRLVSQRLRQIGQRMEAINQNVNQPSLPAHRGDEINELAAAFDAMLARIRRSELRLVESEERMRRLVDHMPVMVDAFNDENRIILWNKECERVTGYSAAEIIDNPKALEMLYPNQTYREAMINDSNRRLNYRDNVWILTTKDGALKKIAFSNISAQCPIPGWHQWAVGVDITEQDAALDALRKSERDFQNLVENAEDLIVRFDSQLRHIYGNSASARRTGLTNEVTQGKKASELPIPPKNAVFIEDALRKVLETGQELTVEQDFPTPAGGAYFETRIVPERNPQGGIESLLAISRDVTGRVLAERAMRRSAEIKAALDAVSAQLLGPADQFEQVAALVLSEAQKLTASEHGFISAVDPASGEEVGLSFSALMQEVNQENPAETKVHLTRHPARGGNGQAVGFMSERQPFIHNELAAAPPLIETPHGHVGLSNLLSHPVISEGVMLGHIVLANKPGGYDEHDAALVALLASRYGLFLERSRVLAALRQSEELYRTFINSTTDLVFLKDSQLRHILVNTAYQEFFSKTEEEVVGKTDFELMPEVFAAACRASDLKALEAMDTTVTREAQGERVYETRKFPVRLGEGQIGVGAFIRDVTDQVRAEETIRAALAERTVLLREVQHRSKNNLQAMISLMQMRDEAIKDPDMHQLLLQLEEQARAMALVYEQLYHSESLSEVSMQAYLSQLVGNLTLAFETGYHIRLEVNAQDASGKPLSLTASRAMPCGLIVNELVTNALKYAFPPGFSGQPTIRVELSANEAGHFCLLVADNGVGLPPGFDPQAQKSLGMRLVRLWATHQMNGKLELKSPPGVQYTITFENSD